MYIHFTKKVKMPTTAFKKILALTVLFCLAGSAVFCQRKYFKVNPGERFLDVIPKEEIYSYADFTDGIVYLKGDQLSNAKLNYNALFGDMQFISEKGDTLGIADEQMIRSIVIKSDTFYFDKGYLKLLANINGMKLANRRYFSFTNKQKVGGFGELSGGSIDTYERISSANIFNDLVAKEVITLSEFNLLYVGDQFNHFKQVNRKNLLDVFSKKRSSLKKYLDENTVDFFSENDIRKLIVYLQALPNDNN